MGSRKHLLKTIFLKQMRIGTLKTSWNIFPKLFETVVGFLKDGRKKKTMEILTRSFKN
jgi:hypothetical protein